MMTALQTKTRKWIACGFYMSDNKPTGQSTFFRTDATTTVCCSDCSRCSYQFFIKTMRSKMFFMKMQKDFLMTYINILSANR